MLIFIVHHLPFTLQKTGCYEMQPLFLSRLRPDSLQKIKKVFRLRKADERNF